MRREAVAVADPVSERAVTGSASAILGQVALGYSAFVDVKRNVSATRLSVLPLRPDGVLDTAGLLSEIAEVWPVGGAQVALNVASVSLLVDLMSTRLPANVMVEIPWFMASDPAHTDAIVRLRAAGTALLLKGRPARELPRAALPCFKYAIVELSDDRRVDGDAPPAGVVRSIPFLQAGVRSIADMHAAFHRGAAAVLGWPIDEAISEAQQSAKVRPAPPANLQVIVDLIQGVDRELPPDRLEQILKRDPQAAYKLLRYINSPGFGLAVQVSSFSHAISLMGYQRLKRWLALLLVTAAKDSDLKPATFAAVRRGLVMEELVRSSNDIELSNDMFVCGVFSLLDRVFGVPFRDLLGMIPVAAPVRQSLIEGTGPLQPYLDAVMAIEAASLHDYRDNADRLMLGVVDVNQAVLRALSTAAQVS